MALCLAALATQTSAQKAVPVSRCVPSAPTITQTVAAANDSNYWYNINETRIAGLIRAGQPRFADVRFTTFKCIDGRHVSGKGSLGTPGGDFAELLLAMAAHERQHKVNLTAAVVEDIVWGFATQFGIPGERPLYWHTAEEVVAELKTKIGNASLDLDWPTADEKKREELLERLVEPDFVGCGHIKKMLQLPDIYKTRLELAQIAIKAFYKALWRDRLAPQPGGPSVILDVLPGDHREGSALLVTTTGCANQAVIFDPSPFGVAPSVGPLLPGQGQVFVLHVGGVVDYLRFVMARYICMKTKRAACGDAANKAAADAIFADQLAKTVEVLAKGRPQHAVAFSAASNAGFAGSAVAGAAPPARATVPLAYGMTFTGLTAAAAPATAASSSSTAKVERHHRRRGVRNSGAAATTAPATSSSGGNGTTPTVASGSSPYADGRTSGCVATDVAVQITKNMSETDATKMWKHLSPAKIRALVLAGKPRFYDSVLATWSCIDGRATEGVFATPGGTISEFVLGLSAYVSAVGRIDNEDTVQAILDSFVSTYTVAGTRRFYMHTDEHQAEAITKLIGPTGITVFPLGTEIPAATYWARLLSYMSTPDYIGCGHLKLTIKNPGIYGVNSTVVQWAVRSFIRAAWADAAKGDGRMLLEVLEGDHVEGGVAVVKTTGCGTQSAAIVPMPGHVAVNVEVPFGSGSIFVFHAGEVAALRTYVSDYFAAALPPPPATTAAAMRASMETNFNAGLGKTVAELAGTLVMTSVVVSAAGSPALAGILYSDSSAAASLSAAAGTSFSFVLRVTSLSGCAAFTEAVAGELKAALAAKLGVASARVLFPALRCLSPDAASVARHLRLLRRKALALRTEDGRVLLATIEVPELDGRITGPAASESKPLSIADAYAAFQRLVAAGGLATLGAYSVTVTLSTETLNAPTPTPGPAIADYNMAAAVGIGVAVAGFIAILATGGVIYWLHRRNRRRMGVAVGDDLHGPKAYAAGAGVA